MNTYDWLNTIPDTSAWRFCHRANGAEKAVFRSRAAADREAARLSRKFDEPYGAYWCERHGGWHLGAKRF